MSPVVIPSSSGRSFRPASISRIRSVDSGRNPFFIRAFVQTTMTVIPSCDHGVVIPSSSGRSFRQRKVLNETLESWVVIPSSSGRSFRLTSIHTTTPYTVVIPSSSGRSFRRHYGPDTHVPESRNPFFIRAFVQTDTHGHARRRPRRRNPFFIRAFVQTPPSAAQAPAGSRRNPFFIRAFVQTASISRIRSRASVVIPSSSGRSFRLSRSGSMTMGGRVVIPSSSGRSFRPTGAAYAPGSASRNPFFIRAFVQTAARDLTVGAVAVVIPSSSGRSFRLLSAASCRRSSVYGRGCREFRFR